MPDNTKALKYLQLLPYAETVGSIRGLAPQAPVPLNRFQVESAGPIKTVSGLLFKRLYVTEGIA
jgi:hypothetical protein